MTHILHTNQTHLWHLPVPLLPLIGREQEVHALTTLLHSDVRLLTLTGTGGVGKTHLALQVANEMQAHFADGIGFVDLAPIRDPDLLLSTLAQALDLKEAGHRPLADLLKALLRHKRLLLLLDNFEQIIKAAPQVADLLAACPHLKILITSRVVLRLGGEHEFHLAPLAVPDPNHLPANETLSQCAAVALFLHQVRRVQPDFQITSANAHTIAQLCVRLDGLPLALELAAVRIKLLSPQDLLARLSRRLTLLTIGARDAPERQQTLRETIAWSYHLLTPHEQRLFQRLSVFVGGCTWEAIEAICGPAEEEELGIPLVEAVTSLLDQSLLQVKQLEGAEPVFLMLETIREYALECLDRSGEAETMRQAHATYYLMLAEEAEPYLSSANQATWLQRLEYEYDNIRSALQWFLAAQKKEEALRMSGALGRFWALSHLSEGQRWFEQVLAASTESLSEREARARMKALYMACGMAYLAGNYARVAELCEASLKIARVLGDKLGIALALNGLGEAALETGDYTKLHAVSQESVPLLREIGNPWRLAEGLFLSAYGHYFHGDPLQARALAEESLTLCQEVGEPFSTIRVLDALGYFAYTQGDLVTAHQRYKESLLTTKEAGRKPFMASCLIALGAVVLAQGQVVWAVQLWGAANEIPLSADLGIYSWHTQMIRTRMRYEQLVADVRTQLGEEAFSAAWAQGQALTMEQILAELENTGAHRQQPTQSAAPASHPVAPSPVKLARRERDILRLLVLGLTHAQIAEQLVLSKRTVNWYLTVIYSKLGVSSRFAATQYTIKHRLLD